MTDERQIIIPASFIALYTPVGKARPLAPRAWLEERHDLCEDFARLLAAQVREKVWSLGITEPDALARVAQGLSKGPLEMSPAETGWVLTRLKELLATGQ